MRAPLGLVAALLLLSGLSHAQAPPPSFFAGRTNDELRAMATDPRGDVLLRRVAATRLVMALADAGDVAAADRAAREFAANIDPIAPKHLATLVRRGRAHLASLVTLGSTLAFAGVTLARARGELRRSAVAIRRLAPFLALLVGYVALVGGGLASRYENSSPLPFVVFGACMVPVVMLFGAWSALGPGRASARALRAGLAVVATLAVGFLAVEGVDPTFLEGVGL